MKVITVVGTRPQFIKAAMISRAIEQHNLRYSDSPITEQLIHTGQHYDENMNQAFFSDLTIPMPTWQLYCGNMTHGKMTGQALIEIEKILLEALPDYVLVYGDTNSTLAGALAASKLHIPIVHVEAGLRSFNKQMPEETNRILTDHISTLLCCPTQTAVRYLSDEGIRQGVFHVGDVMYDAALLVGKQAEKNSAILSKLGLISKSFLLCTIHRAENTEYADRLRQITKALKEIGSEQCPIVLPLHPGTRCLLEKYGLLASLLRHTGIRITEPLCFTDMVMLEKQAATILTDSGGIQKEAYFHRTPCITLREETEWVETVEAGWNQLAGYQTEHIIRCLNHDPVKREINEYGDGNAAGKIVSLL